MPYVFSVRTDACIGCMACIGVCPDKAIAFKSTDGSSVARMREDYKRYLPLRGYPVQVGKCSGCMACANQCPEAGIEVLKNSGKPPYKVGEFFIPD